MKKGTTKTSPSTTTVTKSDGKGAASARRRVYYASQFARTTANKKIRLRRHLRHFPQDQQAIKVCIDRFGNDTADAWTSEAVAAAKRKLNRGSKDGSDHRRA